MSTSVDTYLVRGEVLVGNIERTSDRPKCAHGTWIDHAYVLSGSQRERCSIYGCGA